MILLGARSLKRARLAGAGVLRGGAVAPVACDQLARHCGPLSERTAAEKSALVEVIRAKGGMRESDFVTRFDAHSKLRGAIRALAHEADRSSSCDSGVRDHGTPDTRRRL